MSSLLRGIGLRERRLPIPPRRPAEFFQLNSQRIPGDGHDKELMFVAVVLLVGVLGFALDAGITAAILFHSAERTIVEVRSNAG